MMADRPVLNLAPVTAPSLANGSTPTNEPPAATEGHADAREPRHDTSRKTTRPRRRQSTAPKGAQEPTAQPADAWRSWGPFHQTVSFKWPTELVAELDDRRHDLREPVGLMVIAAVTHLLDQDDKTIRTLIDRVEEAKPRSGRARNRAR